LKKEKVIKKLRWLTRKGERGIPIAHERSAVVDGKGD